MIFDICGKSVNLAPDTANERITHLNEWQSAQKIAKKMSIFTNELTDKPLSFSALVMLSKMDDLCSSSRWKKETLWTQKFTE